MTAHEDDEAVGPRGWVATRVASKPDRDGNFKLGWLVHDGDGRLHEFIDDDMVALTQRYPGVTVKSVMFLTPEQWQRMKRVMSTEDKPPRPDGANT